MVEPPEQTLVPAKPEGRIAGRSVEGRPIEFQVLGDGEEVVFVMGVIHGNEPVGKPLVERLATHLAANAGLMAGRRVVLMPVANPDGLARNTRDNARGVDLNRNFPAQNYASGGRTGAAALSEPESRAVHYILDTHRPSLIVTIHQGLNCIDYDGDAEGWARIMAARSALPVRRVGSRPGSLGSYAGLTLSIPIVTPELPKADSKLSADELWAKYGEMLLAAVQYP